MKMESFDDRKIKEEIDKLEQEHYNKKGQEIGDEFDKEVEKLKKEEYESNKIIRYVNIYLNKNPEKINGEMPLDDFVEIINKDTSDFSVEIRDYINKWIEDNDKEVDFEKPLGDFLDFVGNKGDEAGYLLNPGHEDIEARNQTD